MGLQINSSVILNIAVLVLFAIVFWLIEVKYKKLQHEVEQLRVQEKLLVLSNQDVENVMKPVIQQISARMNHINSTVQQIVQLLPPAPSSAPVTESTTPEPGNARADLNPSASTSDEQAAVLIPATSDDCDDCSL